MAKGRRAAKVTEEVAETLPAVAAPAPEIAPTAPQSKTPMYDAAMELKRAGKLTGSVLTELGRVTP
jgi:hypothetical protein